MSQEKKIHRALAGVVQLVERCTKHHKVAGLIPGWATCWAVGSVPSKGLGGGSQLMSLSPLLPSSLFLNPIKTYFKNTYSTGWWLGALSFTFSSPTNWFHSIPEPWFPHLKDVTVSNYCTVFLEWEVSKANKALTKTFKVHTLPLMPEPSSLHDKMEEIALLTFNFKRFLWVLKQCYVTKNNFNFV